MLVAGDIGGTKTDLAIFSSEAGPHAPLAEVKVHSADYPSLQAIVKEFLAKAQKPVDRACFADATCAATAGASGIPSTSRRNA